MLLLYPPDPPNPADPATACRRCQPRHAPQPSPRTAPLPLREVASLPFVAIVMTALARPLRSAVIGLVLAGSAIAGCTREQRGPFLRDADTPVLERQGDSL